jgi:hypothetical protein
MQINSKKVKSKVTPKFSALLMALTTAFFVVACGGGGSNVASDSASATNNASNTGSTTGAGSGTGTGTGTGAVKNDDDDCKTTTTPTAKSKRTEIDDDDKKTSTGVKVDDDDDKNEIEDDDDKKCTTTPPTPIVATATGALGKIAWTANCISCHTGDLGKGRSAQKTLAAIASNKGGVMGALSGKVSATDAAIHGQSKPLSLKFKNLGSLPYRCQTVPLQPLSAHHPTKPPSWQAAMLPQLPRRQ